MEKLSRRLSLQTGVAFTASTLASRELQAKTRKQVLPLVIFFQGGAQSAFEFVSPLVHSPSEMRGDGNVILASNKMLLDARWPEFARVADKTTVVRSLHAGNVSHDAQPVVGQPGSLGDKLASDGIPHPLIELPSIFRDLSRLDRTIGMEIKWDEKRQRFVPPEIMTDERLDKRILLLEKLDQPISGAAVVRMHENQDLAARLLSGGQSALKSPFVQAEKDRDRYGNHPIGDACALASSLAQSGAGVTVVYNEFGRGWDLHTEMNVGYDRIIPPTDKALSELVHDARRRGFVLLMTSEHGRTPLINNAGGRDHFTTDYAVLAGGSVQEGFVFGDVAKDGNIRSDEIKGGRLMATVLQACGLNSETPAQVVGNLLR